MPTTKRNTTDALKIIDDLHFNGKPKMLALLHEAQEKLLLAERLRELREKKGLSQQEVADRAGTQRSVIARLEKPGYEKHTMSTLRKVCRALGYVMRVDFVAAPASSKPNKTARKLVAKKSATRRKHHAATK